MDQTWYVYRYSRSAANSILKSDETELLLKPEEPNCRARFELKGPSSAIEMVPDPATEAWYGISPKGNIHVRWSRVSPGGEDLLVGQIFDEHDAAERRDFFVAVRSRRGDPLSPEGRIFRFAQCLLTPFGKERLSTWNDLTIRLGGDGRSNIQVGDSTIYTIGPGGFRRHEGGIQIVGWKDDQSLELWLLPNDSTGILLATGCHVHGSGAGAETSFRESGGEDTRPHDPDCIRGLTWISGTSGPLEM